jgi:hypothetical protein
MPIDSAYQTVSIDDFPAMPQMDRCAQRSPHFEEIITRTNEKPARARRALPMGAENAPGERAARSRWRLELSTAP